jgi:MoaA/NifB/PqqE/SkfB family radical SAM enzyme
MKHEGFPIANNDELLRMMIPYFENPESLRVLVQNHASRSRPACTATTNLQIQSNGDVTPCFSMPPVGNIRQSPIRRIWADRPGWWKGGCCMERRMSPAERALVALPTEAARSV